MSLKNKKIFMGNGRRVARRLGGGGMFFFFVSVIGFFCIPLYYHYGARQ